VAFGPGFGTGFGPGFELSEEAGVTVPDVVGDDEATAITALEGVGFVVIVQRRYSGGVVEGNVISQVPSAGQSATSGSTVYIRVSRGPAPTTTGYGFSSSIGNIGFIQ